MEIQPLHCKSNFNIISSAPCCASSPVNHSSMLLSAGGPTAHPVSSRLLLSFTPYSKSNAGPFRCSRGQLSCCSKCILDTAPLPCSCVVLSQISLWMLFLQDPCCTEGVRSWQGSTRSDTAKPHPHRSPACLWSWALSAGAEQWQCLGRQGRKAKMENQGEGVWLNVWKKERERSKWQNRYC